MIIIYHCYLSQSQRKKNKNVKVTIEAENFDRGELIYLKETSGLNSKKMPPIVMNDLVEGSRRPVDVSKNGSASLASSSEAIPPVWFKSYMETVSRCVVLKRRAFSTNYVQNSF